MKKLIAAFCALTFLNACSSDSSTPEQPKENLTENKETNWNIALHGKVVIEKVWHTDAIDFSKYKVIVHHGTANTEEKIQADGFFNVNFKTSPGDELGKLIQISIVDGKGNNIKTPLRISKQQYHNKIVGYETEKQLLINFRQFEQPSNVFKKLETNLSSDFSDTKSFLFKGVLDLQKVNTHNFSWVLKFTDNQKEEISIVLKPGQFDLNLKTGEIASVKVQDELQQMLKAYNFISKNNFNTNNYKVTSYLLIEKPGQYGNNNRSTEEQEITSFVKQ